MYGTNVRLLDLQDNDDFQISAPQCPTHYTPHGNGDVLDVVVHRNVRLSDVTVSDIMDSDHLSLLFHILYHVGPCRNSHRLVAVSKPSLRLYFTQDPNW